MYCKRCGNENDDDASFCEKCGQNLGSTTQKTLKQSINTTKVLIVVVIVLITGVGISVGALLTSNTQTQPIANNSTPQNITSSETQTTTTTTPETITTTQDSSPVKQQSTNKITCLQCNGNGYYLFPPSPFNNASQSTIFCELCDGKGWYYG